MWFEHIIRVEQVERDYDTAMLQIDVLTERHQEDQEQIKAAGAERDAWRARAEEAEAVLAEAGSRDNPVSVPTDGVLHITLPKELPRWQPHIYVTDPYDDSQTSAEHAGGQDS